MEGGNLLESETIESACRPRGGGLLSEGVELGLLGGCALSLELLLEGDLSRESSMSQRAVFQGRREPRLTV